MGGWGAIVFAAGRDVGVAEDVGERDFVILKDEEEVFDGGEDGVFAEGRLVGVAFPGEADAE